METMQNQLWPKHQMLTTKLRIPTLANGIVERPRLYALLDQGLCRPLTMLSAPPGFGKTTLVADWLRRTQADAPCAWVSLSEHDNQPGTFWSYIFRAVDDAVLDSTHQFAELLNTSQRNGLEAALIQWLNIQNERAKPLVVVIDNYQYITSPALNDSLAFVVEHLPEQVHVILLTTHDPPLPLPRWRVRGVVAEIRANKMSCTDDEATAFLFSNEQRRSANEIDSVVKLAEGWFAGLRLISAALQQAPHTPRSLAERSGSYVCEYVHNEVLADQEAEIRTFLLHTCVLDDMCPELCDAVLGIDKSTLSPSYHMLQKLEQLNLFVVPLDGQRNSYRYHRLFREALRHLLMQEPELLQQVSRRASAWCQAHGQFDLAIEYALGGRVWEQAAPLIEHWLHGAAHLRQSDILRRANAWIAQLPAEIACEQRFVAGLQEPKQAVTRVQSTRTVLAREVGAASPLNYTPALPMIQHTWRDPSIQELSAREQEVLALIAEGASNYEIADMLTLSLHTVKRHASNILAKLNAANRTQAVAYARASGFFPAEPASSYGMRS